MDSLLHVNRSLITWNVALVQYLDFDEFDSHLRSMCSHVKAFDIDGTYVATFYGENLNKAKGDSKKDIA